MPNAIFFYRVSRWLYLKRIPFLPKFFQLLIFLMYNCRLPCSASIGKGSFLVVKGIGVSLHDRTSIGENCSIGISCKTVGKSPYKAVPCIGDNVFIGPGAVLVGPIVVEDNVIIGANSVVTKSVPAGVIVAGIPAKIIGKVDDLDYQITDNASVNDTKAEFLKFNS